MTEKILFGNFKGGVGKTTNSVMTAYKLSERGFKVLVVDLDPQANSTQILNRTYSLKNDKELEFESTMMYLIKERYLKKGIEKIKENLYLIPSYKDFSKYPEFLEYKFPARKGTNFKEERISYFSKLMKELEGDFDFIIVDVPPTLSVFVDSALYFCNDIVIVMQTQQRSLDGAGVFFDYLQEFYDKYHNVDFDIVGVLPVLLKNTSMIDSQIIEEAREDFGDNMVFTNVINHLERLKRYDRQGINHKNNKHDNRVHEVYNDMVDELLERIEKLHG